MFSQNTSISVHNVATGHDKVERNAEKKHVPATGHPFQIRNLCKMLTDKNENKGTQFRWLNQQIVSSVTFPHIY